MLVFADSFDHYASADILKKWNVQNLGSPNNYTTSITAGVGRRGTQALKLFCNGTGGGSRSTHRYEVYPDTPVPSGATAIIGFAWFYDEAMGFPDLDAGTTEEQNGNSSSNCLLSVRLANTTQVWFRINKDGTVSVLRGTTLLATSSFRLSTLTWHFLEFKVLIDAAVGRISFRRDMVLDATLDGGSNLNTQGGASAAWNSLAVGGYGHTGLLGGTTNQPVIYYDDLYACDGSGGVNDDFLGDVRVDASMPTAEGTSSDSTPSAGTRATTTDEATANGDTDYNTLAAATDHDSLNFGNAPVAGAAIKAIQANVWARKEDAGIASLKAMTRVNGTDYFGDERGVPSSYVSHRQIWDENPDDSAAWEDTDFNAAEFGYQKFA